jgi:hypothetical protein
MKKHYNLYYLLQEDKNRNPLRRRKQKQIKRQILQLQKKHRRSGS